MVEVNLFPNVKNLFDILNFLCYNIIIKIKNVYESMKGSLCMRINIDKEIDNQRCPGSCLCDVATTCYKTQVRENICYHCWLAYCKEHNIEIIYD